jgi:Mn2+/Fe2+ NRAMP family transporter
VPTPDLPPLFGLAIMVTAAATLHAAGTTDVETAVQAAEALRPVAGPSAFALFALGILGTGFLAVPVLAGSAAYGIGEARGWPAGLTRSLREARAFYATIALAALGGIAVNITSLDPIRALSWSAVINGVVAAPMLALSVLLASRPDVMDRFTISRQLKIMGWSAVLPIAASVTGMILTAFLG